MVSAHWPAFSAVGAVMMMDTVAVCCWRMARAPVVGAWWSILPRIRADVAPATEGRGRGCSGGLRVDALGGLVGGVRAESAAVGGGAEPVGHGLRVLAVGRGGGAGFEGVDGLVDGVLSVRHGCPLRG